MNADMQELRERLDRMEEMTLAAFNASGLVYLALTGRAMQVMVPHKGGFLMVGGPPFDPRIGPTAPAADEGAGFGQNLTE